MESFDLYFATIVGWQYHPGAGKLGHTPLTLAECAELALKMVRVRNAVLSGVTIDELQKLKA